MQLLVCARHAKADDEAGNASHELAEQNGVSVHGAGGWVPCLHSFRYTPFCTRVRVRVGVRVRAC